MEKTLVGYTGGDDFEPNYNKIGDHTEAILVEYTEDLSFDDILRKFWQEHTPGVSSRQYRSAVFYHDESQRVAAEEMKAELIGGGKSWCKNTAIEPAKEFWQAEAYHQKYLAKMIGTNSIFANANSI